MRVKIVGVGGAGTNAVDRLRIDDDNSKLLLAALNTDAQALNSSPAAGARVASRRSDATPPKRTVR